jgi:RNA-binding protein NOB1
MSSNVDDNGGDLWFAEDDFPAFEPTPDVKAAPAPIPVSVSVPTPSDGPKPVTANSKPTGVWGAPKSWASLADNSGKGGALLIAPKKDDGPVAIAGHIDGGDDNTTETDTNETKVTDDEAFAKSTNANPFPARPAHAMTGAETETETSIAAGPDGDSDLTDLVLDSGAFIADHKVVSYGPHVRYWTIPEVIEEIRDENARRKLDTFPYEIKTRQVSYEALKSVSEFAKSTGDFFSLSATDIKVLALAYMLEVERNGTVNLRSATHAADAANRQAAAAAANQASKQFVLRTDVLPFDIDSVLFSTPEQYEKSAGKKHIEEEMPSGNKHTSNNDDDAGFMIGSSASLEVKGSDGSNDEATSADTNAGDSNDGEGDWITPGNIREHQAREREQHTTSPPVNTSVGCITTDFTMQNVMLQLGLRLLSVQGYAITALRRWVMRCHGCLQTSQDMSLQFCPACGGHTMVRMQAIVSADGKTRYRGGWRQIYGKRLLMNDLAKPSGGRHCKDPVLRGDQLFRYQQPHNRVRKKKDTDLFSRANEFGMDMINPNKQRHRQPVGLPKANRGKRKNNKRNRRRR